MVHFGVRFSMRPWVGLWISTRSLAFWNSRSHLGFCCTSALACCGQSKRSNSREALTRRRTCWKTYCVLPFVRRTATPRSHACGPVQIDYWCDSGLSGNGGLAVFETPFSRIALPHTSRVRQWQFAFSLLSSACMLSICSAILLSSASLQSANFCQRASARVPS
jgi:hypothetical protein